MTDREKIEELERYARSLEKLISNLAARIEELEIALREIANLRYSNTSAAEIARAALDKDASK